MRILVLNGNPDETRPEFDRCCDDYVAAINARGQTMPAGRERHAGRQIRLRERAIRPCNGCWSCWWATPGRCALKDDMEPILRTMVGADLLVWASPLIEGTASAITKAAQERVIPLLHPYIEISHGECHHRRRYPRNFDMAVLYGTSEGDGPGDIESIGTLFGRFAVNGRGSLRFCLNVTSLEEALHVSLAA